MLRKYNFQSYGQRTINSDDLGSIDGSYISCAVHDQKDSYLCWLFSISTSLKCSVRYFIEKLKLSTIQRERCLEKLYDSTLHHSIRMELCMLIPTILNSKDEKQAMSVVSVLRRVSYYLLCIVFIHTSLKVDKTNSIIAAWYISSFIDNRNIGNGRSQRWY